VNNRDNGSSFLVGAMIGAAIGAVIGILYAPAPGEVTRKKVKEKGKETLDDVQEAVELQDKITPVLNDLKKASEPTREAIAQKVEELSQEVKNRVKEEKDTLRKKYFNGTKQV
jgi:gas vesicle protein